MNNFITLTIAKNGYDLIIDRDKLISIEQIAKDTAKLKLLNNDEYTICYDNVIMTSLHI